MKAAFWASLSFPTAAAVSAQSARSLGGRKTCGRGESSGLLTGTRLDH